MLALTMQFSTTTNPPTRTPPPAGHDPRTRRTHPTQQQDHELAADGRLTRHATRPILGLAPATITGARFGHIPQTRSGDTPWELNSVRGHPPDLPFPPTTPTSQAEGPSRVR
jgi:hypothetical protein